MFWKFPGQESEARRTRRESLASLSSGDSKGQADRAEVVEESDDWHTFICWRKIVNFQHLNPKIRYEIIQFHQHLDFVLGILSCRVPLDTDLEADVTMVSDDHSIVIREHTTKWATDVEEKIH